MWATIIGILVVRAMIGPGIGLFARRKAARMVGIDQEAVWEKRSPSGILRSRVVNYIPHLSIDELREPLHLLEGGLWSNRLSKALIYSRIAGRSRPLVKRPVFYFQGNDLAGERNEHNHLGRLS